MKQQEIAKLRRQRLPYLKLIDSIVDDPESYREDLIGAIDSGPAFRHICYADKINIRSKGPCQLQR